MSNDNQFSADNVSKLMGIDSGKVPYQGTTPTDNRVIIEPSPTTLLQIENGELKLALTDLVKAYLTLSRACGDGLDALNRHAKVVMSLGVDLRETK